MTDVARATGGRVWREGTVLCVHHPLPRDELHLLFPARLEPDELERVLDWCARNRVRTAGCWSSGIGDDERVRTVLEANGFEEGWQPHWMAAALPLRDAEPDARVEPATEVPEYDAYGQALLAMTRVRRRDRRSWHLVAREDGRLAGMAWLHLP